jgi:hypothetical protein
VYLRARYYSPATGRFITKDSWQGDYYRPLSLNRWMYVEGNPIKFTDASGKTRTQPYGQSTFNECISSQQLQGVNTSVKQDVCKMIPELEAAGFYEDIPDQEHITGGYRDPKIAHRVSTAYHIIHDLISVDDLKKTPRDLDGTIWYKDEWKYLFPECENANIAIAWLEELRIKQNAAARIPAAYYNKDFYVWEGIFRIKSSPYALEGYPSGDSHRPPNSNNPSISKHVLGLAVDIFNGCENLDLMWSQEIDTIAIKYHLVRPYKDLKIDYANAIINEWWHFERP